MIQPVKISAMGPVPLHSRRIGAVVMLAGAVGSGELETAAGRARLDLPITAGQSVGRQWVHALEAVSARGLFAHDDVIRTIMLDQKALDVSLAESRRRNELDLRLRRDPNEFRGTGGVLHDVARDWDDDLIMLVGNGPQVLLTPLEDVVEQMLAEDADVVLVTDRTHVPVPVMLVRCGVLRDLPEIGFVDFKEQALPGIAKAFRVMAIRFGDPVALPIRTRANYIEAVRTFHRRHAGIPERHLVPERWQRTFAIVESGAAVDSSACLHDSVVLSGARIEAGAVVIRSVVGPGALVRRNQSVVDACIGGVAATRPEASEVQA